MSSNGPASQLRQGELGLLQRAIALSAESVGRGGRPFGALVCDGQGRIVSEAGAIMPTDPRDWTAHSEMLALRAASARMTWDELSRATIFASGEPCPMCAAAIYWCNVRRLVFSVSEPSMRALREPFERAAGIAMRSEEIFSRCGRDVQVLGPIVEEQGLAVHRSYWLNAPPDA